MVVPAGAQYTAVQVDARYRTDDPQATPATTVSPNGFATEYG